MSETKELIEAVKAAATEENGKLKLACADAFRLAGKFDAELMDIGRICNRRKIRICQCQLGCFR